MHTDDNLFCVLAFFEAMLGLKEKFGINVISFWKIFTNCVRGLFLSLSCPHKRIRSRGITRRILSVLLSDPFRTAWRRKHHRGGGRSTGRRYKRGRKCSQPGDLEGCVTALYRWHSCLQGLRGNICQRQKSVLWSPADQLRWPTVLCTGTASDSG